MLLCLLFLLILLPPAQNKPSTLNITKEARGPLFIPTPEQAERLKEARSPEIRGQKIKNQEQNRKQKKIKWLKLPTFRFVGQVKVAGVVEKDGDLRFLAKREVGKQEQKENQEVEQEENPKKLRIILDPRCENVGKSKKLGCGEKTYYKDIKSEFRKKKTVNWQQMRKSKLGHIPVSKRGRGPKRRRALKKKAHPRKHRRPKAQERTKKTRQSRKKKRHLKNANKKNHSDIKVEMKTRNKRRVIKQENCILCETSLERPRWVLI